jgi:hypothetical protein
MLIKKADVKKYYADRRALGIVATRPLSRPDAAGLLKDVPAGTKAVREESLEDVPLEHASSGGPIALIAGVSGTSQAATVAGSLQA